VTDGVSSPGVCSIVWSTELEFVVSELPDVVVDWAVSASSPDAGGSDFAAGSAAFARFDWFAPPFAPGLPTRIVTLRFVGWVWLAVAAPGSAESVDADAFAVFDCVTGPPSPGLLTRTSTFVFPGEA
jgi:hypothetical protein